MTTVVHVSTVSILQTISLKPFQMFSINIYTLGFLLSVLPVGAYFFIIVSTASSQLWV